MSRASNDFCSLKHPRPCFVTGLVGQTWSFLKKVVLLLLLLLSSSSSSSSSLFVDTPQNADFFGFLMIFEIFYIFLIRINIFEGTQIFQGFNTKDANWSVTSFGSQWTPGALLDCRHDVGRFTGRMAAGGRHFPGASRRRGKKCEENPWDVEAFVFPLWFF